MAEGAKKGYSGIGGQAVLEGVMMKNGEKYAVAVRKPDGNIAIEVEHYAGFAHSNIINKIPFVRGIFNFVDSMILGMRALNYSTTFYDEESSKESARDSKKVDTSSSSNAGTVIVSIISFIIAIGLFVILPTYVASLFEKTIRNNSLMALIEGAIRIFIFLAYILLISLMKDIRRLYRYHGAEHKCINCIEKGRPLTVTNVMRSSRFHRRCGTSFLFLVVFISVIIFFFIRTDSIWIRFLIRLAMIPVVAGISYEVLRLTGRYDNWFVKVIAAPGLLVQRITTKEPDKYMVQVAIASIEAVFDWKAYLEEAYGYGEGDVWVEDDKHDPKQAIDDEDEVSSIENTEELVNDVDDWDEEIEATYADVIGSEDEQDADINADSDIEIVDVADDSDEQDEIKE